MPVDLSDMDRMHGRMAQGLSEIPDVLISEAKDGAARARADHAYQNRTGDLTKSTKAKWERRSKYGGTVVIVADTPYANFVRKRGLMSIDKHALATQKAIEEELVRRAR